MSKPNVFKLLAIDDDPQTLSLITDALEGEGVEILTASEPEAGFDLFVQSRPRIVLLDFVMPKISGLELLERILAADPAANVIIITGHYSTESAIEAIQRTWPISSRQPRFTRRLREGAPLLP